MKSFFILLSIILLCNGFPGAFAQYDSLKNLLTSASDQETKIQVYIQLGRAMRNSLPDSAIYYCREAQNLIDQTSLEKYLPECLSFIGLSYRTKTEYESALEYFNKALSVALKLNDSLQIAYSHNNIGGIYRLKSAYIQALNHIIEARTIFEYLGDQEGKIYCDVNLAVLYRYQNELDKSYHYLEEAIAYRREINEVRGLATCYSLMAENLYLDGKYAEAMKYYNMAKAIYYEKGGAFEKAANNNGVASVMLKMGMADSSLFYRKKALELAESIHDDDQTIRALIGIAEAYAHVNQLNIAKDHILKAVDLADKRHLENRQLEAWMVLSEVSMKLGDHQQALSAFQNYVRVKDTIFSNEKSWQLQEIQTMYNTREQERLLLEQEKALHTEQIRNAWLLAGISFALAIIVILSLYYRNKTKFFRIISQENAIIQEQKKKLAAMNETNHKLFTVIAHDLRSPFQALLGLSQVIQEESVENCPENINIMVHKLYLAANNAYSLVENLLDWSKIQFGQLEMKKQNIMIGNLIDTSLDLFELRINEKKLMIIKNLQFDQQFESDPNLLSGILRNIIGNAVKFTPDHGTIRISTTNQNGSMTIEVDDSGIGMDASQLENLIRLKPIDSTSGTRNEKGSGLGLVICRDFTQMIGGTFEAESTPGQGTTFRITVPLS